MPVHTLKSVAFDLSKWHGGVKCEVAFVTGIGGIGVKIVCHTCHVLCDVEATGVRIPPSESWHARQPVEVVL